MQVSSSVQGLQQTLASPAVVSGRGLFHGIETHVRMLPAPADSGIVFRRTDLPGNPEIPARTQSVVPGARRTILSAAGASVETTEHLLAALAGLQVDNCIIEVSAVEIPAVDGSCLPFCNAILEAGIQALSAPRRFLRVSRCQRVSDPAAEQWLEATPGGGNDLVVGYQLDYGDQSPIGQQSLALSITPDVFLSEIAAARTFVLSSEVEWLQSQGYGRHLTGQDLVVFAPDGSIIENKLRWPDEPVRHKILDCIGDLALAGAPIAGRIVARRSGHKLNHVMAQILSTTDISILVPSRAA
jgi:UDP-3-O-acyl N-acetylglucosamine deacetylase